MAVEDALLGEVRAMRCASILRLLLLALSVAIVEAAVSCVCSTAATRPNQIQGSPPAGSQMCGPNALYMFLRAHDLPVVADSFFREVEPGDQGLSLAQLRDASTRYGLPAEIRRCTYQELVGAVPFPLVVLLQPGFDDDQQHAGHYVLVLDANSEGVSLVDGTSGELIHLGRHRFCRNWQGYVLVEAEGRFSWLLIWAGTIAAWILAAWALLRSNRSKAGTERMKVLEVRPDASSQFAGPSVSK